MGKYGMLVSDKEVEHAHGISSVGGRVAETPARGQGHVLPNESKAGKPRHRLTLAVHRLRDMQPGQLDVVGKAVATEPSGKTAPPKPAYRTAILVFAISEHGRDLSQPAKIDQFQSGPPGVILRNQNPIRNLRPVASRCLFGRSSMAGSRLSPEIEDGPQTTHGNEGGRISGAPWTGAC